MTKDPRVYLVQILERVERIEAFTADGEAAFLDDVKTQDAVIRHFEVIGEAAKRVPERLGASIDPSLSTTVPSLDLATNATRTPR